MQLYSRLIFSAWALACLGVAVGCGGPGGTTTPVTPSSTAQSVSASLVYPTSVATLPGETPGPSFATVGGIFGNSETLVFAVQGTLNSTYQVVLSPTPPPQSAGGTSPAPAFMLNLSPTSLPSPLAPAPANGATTYVTAQGPGLREFTTYSVSLAGCQSGTPCSSPSPIFAGTLQTACTTEVAPSPIPSFAMALPANGATAVPDAIGQLIVAGGSGGAYGLNSVTLTSQAGATILASTPTPLSSPWPNNLATPGPYFEVAVPALAASTSYTMTVNWPTQSFVPPCVTTVPQTLGSFTTQ